ncbi:TetR family transcriptional regulator [Neptunomonas sp. CHC150]|uniref:TetR/AcrR family transcriptional regulator n=1 Tax=Neptunomonas sp. CHC150 TaxID=2998324 RepID=UPI0025B0A7CC|nr:TetR/AcrR family transcriptional regulator [Neptunomonas sp. CHC150]MDN2661448.1 TetR family transcriptional regulator [Neptunomonas sp. CHC150]
MARKTKEEALKTYHAILDASAVLFNKQGASHTTLNDIAKYTGMTRGAVYWHFENKEDVIRALWQRDASHLLKNTFNALLQLNEPEPVEYFKSTIKRMISTIAEDEKASQAVRIVMNSVEATTQQTDLQTFLEDKAQSIYSHLLIAIQNLADKQKLRKDYSPELLASALWSYAHGLIDINMQDRCNRINLIKDGDALIDLFLENWFTA